MQIANPIYDVVFKYLMEDAKIAKLLISSIIGQDVLDLEFMPQEFTTDLVPENPRRRKPKTVYQMDFAAKIGTPEGQKQVIVEIQKAKFATDIMRFRKYLGEQYANPNNTRVVRRKGRKRKVGMPIISIYLLGHRLENTSASVIGIRRSYTDLVTGQPIEAKEDFIESLSHDSFVVQIPMLAHRRRTELEVLLSIFDQTNVSDFQQHVLSVSEEDFLEEHKLVLRKLQAAILDYEIKKKMFLEDGLLDELEMMDREIEEMQQQFEAERTIREKTEQEKLEALREMEIALREKETALQQKEKSDLEKLRALQEKEKSEQEKLRALQEKEKFEQELERLRIQLEELQKRDRTDD